jgi:hypothetical protein
MWLAAMYAPKEVLPIETIAIPHSHVWSGQLLAARSFSLGIIHTTHSSDGGS